VIDELEHRRATGKSDFVKTLADEVEKGGIAAWKALRELLPRDEDIPSGSPSMSFSQLFIAAHKEINRSEQMKTVPGPVAELVGIEGGVVSGVFAAAPDPTKSLYFGSFPAARHRPVGTGSACCLIAGLRNTRMVVASEN
jgi:hypothetical protein